MGNKRFTLSSAAQEFALEIDPIGARISSIIRIESDTEFLLRTEWGEEDWTLVPPAHDSNEEWHRRYPGGWHTLVPHSGNPRTLDGVEHPFHGEAAWRIWRLVEREATSAVLEVTLRTAPLRIRRRIEVLETGVRVSQSITNFSKVPFSFTWTEHPAFGDALVGPRSTLEVGGESVTADFTKSGFMETSVNGKGVATLRNPETGCAATLTWDASLMPYVYLWQEHGNHGGSPWWGTTNTAGIEPASRPYHHEGESLGPIQLSGSGTIDSTFSLELSVLDAVLTTSNTTQRGRQ